MSWNTNLQINNLTNKVNNLAQTALTNPMVNALNMSNYNINNANQVNCFQLNARKKKEGEK